MCANVIRKHDDSVFIFGHTKSHVDALAELGGIVCGSYREVAQRADLIFTMVATSAMSEAVYDEMLPVLKEGKICADMATIDPDVSVAISERVKAAGAQFLDAPVVRSRPDAIAGNLGILVGGDREVFETVRPYLLYMGREALYLGKNGSGLIMKICHNALCSQIQNGVNETFSLAAANGIDIGTYAKAVSLGGGQNFYLESKAESLAEDDYTVCFSVRNMAKDVNLSLALAEKSGVDMPAQRRVKEVFDQALDAGYAEEDYSITLKIVQDGTDRC